MTKKITPEQGIARTALALILGAIFFLGSVYWFVDGIQRLRFLLDYGENPTPQVLDLTEESALDKEIKGLLTISGYPGTQYEYTNSASNEFDLHINKTFYLVLFADQQLQHPVAIVQRNAQVSGGEFIFFQWFPDDVSQTPAAFSKDEEVSFTGMNGYYATKIPSLLSKTIEADGLEISKLIYIDESLKSGPSWKSSLILLSIFGSLTIAGLVLLVMAWKLGKKYVL